MPFSTTAEARKTRDAAKVSSSVNPKTNVGYCYADLLERYPQGSLVSYNDQETARLLTKTIASSLSSFQPVQTMTDDVGVFNAAVRGVIEAVRDQVITEEEGDAIIEMISRALASRRVNAAFSHLAESISPVVGTLGVNSAK